jgi:ubiquinone/menaquinone biosynthesis C-methylase UbiE
MQGRQAHWDHVYAAKPESELSWFQENPAVSLELIRAAGTPKGGALIDVGGGASRLVDALLAEGLCDLTVLDLSRNALAAAKTRLGPRADEVTWIANDVTAWEPARRYDLWHDRAAFHFLTEAADRQAYAARVRRAVRSGGHVIIGTFALDGPERCSGLPVMRHDAASIGAVLGEDFVLIESRRHDHMTPANRIQHFQFSLFRRGD